MPAGKEAALPAGKTRRTHLLINRYMGCGQGCATGEGVRYLLGKEEECSLVKDGKGGV